MLNKTKSNEGKKFSRQYQTSGPNRSVVLHTLLQCSRLTRLRVSSPRSLAPLCLTSSRSRTSVKAATTTFARPQLCPVPPSPEAPRNSLLLRKNTPTIFLHLPRPSPRTHSPTPIPSFSTLPCTFQPPSSFPPSCTYHSHFTHHQSTNDRSR